MRKKSTQSLMKQWRLVTALCPFIFRLMAVFLFRSSRGIEALIRRYEMEQGDDVWLCTYKLKEIGCDLEKWEKERGDQ